MCRALRTITEIVAILSGAQQPTLYGSVRMKGATEVNLCLYRPFPLRFVLETWHPLFCNFQHHHSSNLNCLFAFLSPDEGCRFVLSDQTPPNSTHKLFVLRAKPEKNRHYMRNIKILCINRKKKRIFH